MKKLLSAALALAVWTSLAAAESPRVLAPDQVKPGMKGYALTVFSGLDPEPFEIEVVGRLHRVFPGQDLILIKALDERVRGTRIASGMSGSPVYLRVGEGDDRLIGAIGYGWSFSTDAIAGVTPITSMLNSVLGPGEGGDRPTLGADYRKVTGDPTALAARSAPPPTEGGMSPISTPLMVSGAPPSLMSRLRQDLAPLGLEPMQGGSGGDADGIPARRFRPGDAIGVQLIGGDMSWVAIGTVTHVDGENVLAFGHPFLQGGQWEAPVTNANVQTILSSSNMSFKLANSGAVVGSLSDDNRSCIAAVMDRRARTIPCEVSVSGPARADASFKYDFADHPFLLGNLSYAALYSSLNDGYPLSEYATLTVSQRIEIEGQPPLEADMVVPASSSFAFGMMRPLMALAGNPFQAPRFTRLSYRVTIQPERRTARVVSARVEKHSVERGGIARAIITVRPFESPDVELPFSFEVPADYPTGPLTVSFLPGDEVSPMLAAPRTLAEYIRYIEAYHRYSSENLIAVVPLPSTGLAMEGRMLPSLPGSVANVLAPPGARAASGFRARREFPLRTEWVLEGSASVALTVRE